MASAQDLEVTAQPALYPEFNKAITDYVVRCTVGSPIDMTVAAASGTSVDVDGQGPRSGDFTTAVSIDPGQKAALAVLAERSGFSESALTRLALNRLLSEPAIFLPAVNSTTTHNATSRAGKTAA